MVGLMLFAKSNSSQCEEKPLNLTGHWLPLGEKGNIMKTTLTLAEVKAIYGETCFETETSFGVNLFGKYQPNMTFIIPKVFDLGKDGKPISPMSYVEDREITDNMNLDFDGSASFIFGDFWRSKKGGACFRPKNPMQAKHLLIEVSWGGCFNKHRGRREDEVNDIEGVLYFRRARSNQGGLGSDYWVVPVGFTRVIHDEEIDGNTKADHTKLFEQRAKAYRKRHADLQKTKIEEADTYLKEKAASEEASRANKDKFIPRLNEIQAELVELCQGQKFVRYYVEKFSFGETYFKFRGCQYLYSEQGLAEVEKYLARTRVQILDEEAKKQAKADAIALFKPKFEESREKVERIGCELSFDEEEVSFRSSVRAYFYKYTTDGLEKFREDVRKEADRIAEEERRARNAERIRSILSDTELPEGLWFLFEDSDDLDSVILGEAEAILRAKKSEKDEMDLHELNNCGYDRRCEAIYRVLSRVGGGKAKINIKSQSDSKSLAWYIAG